MAGRMSTSAIVWIPSRRNARSDVIVALVASITRVRHTTWLDAASASEYGIICTVTQNPAATMHISRVASASIHMTRGHKRRLIAGTLHQTASALGPPRAILLLNMNVRTLHNLLHILSLLSHQNITRPVLD
ncbi:hypothetical protein CBL_02669 [Carabus blaptoides fortunei]